MRLTAENISHATVIEYEGKPYAWHITLKDRHGRTYASYRPDGCVDILKGFPKEDLPKGVAKFLDTHEWELADVHEYEDGKYLGKFVIYSVR